MRTLTLKTLIAVADKLDALGFHKAASEIDDIIKNAAEPRLPGSKKEDDRDKKEQTCRNCKKNFLGYFKGWHEKFCSKHCETRFKQRQSKKSAQEKLTRLASELGDDLLPGEAEDIENLMRGWDTDKDYNFPNTNVSTSPYPPSRFIGDNLTKADVWYTYNRFTLDSSDRNIDFPDTIESMQELSKNANLSALIAFPESIDFLLEFDDGSGEDRHFAMSAQTNDEEAWNIADKISRDEAIKYGTLVTNEQFAKYAKEHGFTWWPSRP